MQTTIYATYDFPEFADMVFVELLEKGAILLDIFVVTRETYQGELMAPDDGWLAVMEPEDSAERTPTPANLYEDIPFLPGWDPFDMSEDGMSLIDRLTSAGDLASCLRALGFEPTEATDAERVVLQGGAILVFRVPSGSVNYDQAFGLISQSSGSVRGPSGTNPYML